MLVALGGDVESARCPLRHRRRLTCTEALPAVTCVLTIIELPCGGIVVLLCRGSRSPMTRTRPPQQQQRKVPKTWDEGEGAGCVHVCARVQVI